MKIDKVVFFDKKKKVYLSGNNLPTGRLGHIIRNMPGKKTPSPPVLFFESMVGDYILTFYWVKVEFLENGFSKEQILKKGEKKEIPWVDLQGILFFLTEPTIKKRKKITESIFLTNQEWKPF